MALKYHTENSIQQSIFSFISIYFTDHCSKGDNKQNTRNIPLMRPFQFLQFTYMQITSCNLMNIQIIPINFCLCIKLIMQ